MGYTLQVGAPYPRQVDWPDAAANLVLNDQYVEIIYSFRGLTPDERTAFNTGAAAFAVVVGERHLMWCYRFEARSTSSVRPAALGWGDSPWEAHRQTARPVGVPGKFGEPFTAYMVLVDAFTGVVEGLRPVEVESDVANTLRAASSLQLSLPYDEAAATQEINAVYLRHPNTQSLVASWEVVYGFDLIRGFAPASG